MIASVVFIKKNTKIKRLHQILIFFIPVLSLLSVFTGHIPFPFLTNPEVHIQDGVPFFTYIKNIGFFINAIYSYILILISCYLLLIRSINSPKIYRTQSLFVFVGCTSSFIINILFITQKVFIIPIDTTPIFILVTLTIFYWGVYHLPKALIVPYARDLVIENIKDLLFVIDNNECIIDVNPKALEFLQLHADQKLKKADHISKLIGINIYDVIKHIPDIKELTLPLNISKENTLVVEKDGHKLYYIINSEEIYDTDKLKIGRLYLLHDLTQMTEQLNHLVKLNEELVISDKIINQAIEGIIITDAKNVIVRANESMLRMSGYTNEDIIGQDPRIFRSDYHDDMFYQQMWNQITTKGFWEGEIWDRRKNGEVYPKWMSITTINDPNDKVTNYIAISSDITKMKKAEQDIHLLEYYDLLTGIPNRTLFYDRLNLALSRAKRNNSCVALCYMDIDRFKLINDSLGHDAGDILLVEVSKRIQSVIREEDMLSRLGGDEFTLIMEGDNCSEDVANIAEKIIKEINKPLLLKGKEVSVGISIGIALAPHDDSTLEGIIRKADSAMYHSKETGRGKYVFSSAEIEKRNQEQLELQIRLKQALVNEEFELFLQPQLSYIDHKYKIIGAEALIRWNCEGTIIPPGKFIPAAEENGLILPISNWITAEIFKIDKILKENNIDTKLAINMSVKQFENKDFIKLLQKLLEEYSSQNIQLVIEITESMFINDLVRAIEYLQEIKALGISIALDDFGTGFSSLSYLTRLPIDYLKIDRSFVSRLDEIQNRNLTYSIISMAKTLSLKTLAEGVETLDQAEKLVEKDCDELQGYYFSKPITVSDFIAFYQHWNSNN
jgi:diguanylate cyclase (GGDEF)-like protein/PAS domain S-box-containing protein